jgi:hypothetical protein
MTYQDVAPTCLTWKYPKPVAACARSSASLGQTMPPTAVQRKPNCEPMLAFLSGRTKPYGCGLPSSKTYGPTS